MVYPALEDGDFVLGAVEFAKYYCRLLGVPGCRFAVRVLGFVFCPLDCRECEVESLFESAFTFQFLNGLDRLKVVYAVGRAMSDFGRPFGAFLCL